jgi:hypothetical protein
MEKQKQNKRSATKDFMRNSLGMKKPPEDHLYVRPQVLSRYTCALVALLGVA